MMRDLFRKLYQPMSARVAARTSGGMVGIKAPKQAPQEGRRGVALIMVLVITTVLSAVATDLKNHSQVNLRASANARDELQAHFHARSAVELELFVLRFQNQLKSTLGQFLPIPFFELSGFIVSSDTMKGILDRDGPTPTDEPRSASLSQPFGDFNGSFWVEKIVDENRKININGDYGSGCSNFLPLLIGAVFDNPKYDVLFESMGDSRDAIRNRVAVIANIMDWIDGNRDLDTVCMLTEDRSQSSVPEDTRYDHLPYNATYKPKNALMSSLAELRMVPYVNDAFMRVFAKYFTVWSDNVGISMQTADDAMILAVIRAISAGPVVPGDVEKYKKFFEERALMMALPGGAGKLSKPAFEQLLQVANIQYNKARLDELDNKKFVRFDDISSVYRITAVGRVNGASAKIHLVWRGFGTNGETYYWREE